jgi:hypothetical protein
MSAIFCTFKQPINPKVPTLFQFRFVFAVIFTWSVFLSNSQNITAFKVNKKWGFKQGEAVIIEPEYDSIYGFDPSGQICLVGNIDPLRKSVNSLTREVKIPYTFRYINSKNERLYFKAPNALDSSSEATPSKYSGALYRIEGDLIIACISGKKVLATKKGKQLSSEGYESIHFTKVPGFLLFELKDNSSSASFFGIMDNEAKRIIPPSYSKISFNIYDSLIYCCTAGIRFNGNDDIYNYKGEKIHTSSRHIQCAGKNFVVYRMFASENSYVILDIKQNKEHTIKAEYIYYLKNDVTALLDDDWFFYDLRTDKRTPMDKKIVKFFHLDEY